LQAVFSHDRGDVGVMMLNRDAGQATFCRVCGGQPATGEIGMQITGDPFRGDSQNPLQMLDGFFQRPAGFGIVETANMW